MPEARDRLSRPEGLIMVFRPQTRSIGRGIGILADEPEVDFGGPFRWGATAMTGTGGPIGVAATRANGGGGGRGSFGTPRIGNRRRPSLYGSPIVGRQNITQAESGRRGLRRSTNSVLPSWYPRTPLGDITAVVRAIERRRARLGESEGLQIGSPLFRDQIVLDPSVSAPDAQLEHDISINSPNPTIGTRPFPQYVGKVPKILLNITNQNAGESDILTPQKKLLNSIDTVEKVVMEELCKLKRTPSAKKAEREKRVRTLMSMR